eukprot:CAMPEP_0182863470 /NCGR_PEP_ID=MMETSP0034_2-20130328/6656_1 /TAXON_ID=156128 /ORGANISM="Nephroselmis pyriformis, Strain CCMP717" /LENGTH=175 /DNA_ID=CAMNT_0024995677 /DNA_START=53 /DNA_END=578 /DNA_ORIENTATION=-
MAGMTYLKWICSTPGAAGLTRSGASSHGATGSGAYRAGWAGGRDLQWEQLLAETDTPNVVPGMPCLRLHNNKLVGSIPAEFSVMTALPLYAPFVLLPPNRCDGNDIGGSSCGQRPWRCPSSHCCFPAAVAARLRSTGHLLVVDPYLTQLGFGWLRYLCPKADLGGRGRAGRAPHW